MSLNHMNKNRGLYLCMFDFKFGEFKQMLPEIGYSPQFEFLQLVLGFGGNCLKLLTRLVLRLLSLHIKYNIELVK